MRSDQEIEALEARVEALEAKLREAEERAEKAEREMSAILDTMPADVVVRVREGAGPESVAASLAVSVAKLRGRLAKAEREREQAREALKFAADAFVSVWAALGDRLLARSPLDRAYANSVSEKCRNAEKACRAALGENP